jgi:hypothetical protein
LCWVLFVQLIVLLITSCLIWWVFCILSQYNTCNKTYNGWLINDSGRC